MNNFYANQEGTKRITAIKTDRVAELRSRKSLSREQFAADVSISPDMVKKLEKRERGLTLDIALKIAEAYNITLDWLFGVDNETQEANLFMDLRKIFKINFSEKVYETENGTAQKEYPTLSIDKQLAALLKDIENVEKLKEDGKLPDNIFELWIDDIKKKCNNLLSNNDTEEKITYICVADNKVADLILNADCNQALEDIVKNMGREQFINDLKYETP
jgi:transcriptional regulator with XRE-family HTH domain